MVLDGTLLNSYRMLRIKDKRGNPGEMSVAHVHLGIFANEKRALMWYLTPVVNFTYLLIYVYMHKNKTEVIKAFGCL